MEYIRSMTSGSSLSVTSNGRGSKLKTLPLKEEGIRCSSSRTTFLCSVEFKTSLKRKMMSTFMTLALKIGGKSTLQPTACMTVHQL